MQFLIRKNENIQDHIKFHKVSNKEDDSFVGIKIKNGEVEFCYPQTYDFDESSIDQNREDIIAILQTISNAKTYSNPKIKIESSFSNNGVLPLVSYLWILKDYLTNGFYINREQVLKKNQRGKIDWKRTLNEQPIVSKGNIIYRDFVVSVKNDLDNIIVQIHKYCVKSSINYFGWLFGIYSSDFIEIAPFYDGLKEVYIDTLNKELNQTFNDEKKIRLTHMLSIIEGLDEKQNQDELIYGVESYENVFEQMINSIFGNQDPSNFYPSSTWHLNVEGLKKPFNSTELRPDTILIKDNNAYILDSKFYQFGYTADTNGLPGTSSIQKQITYGDFIKNNKKGEEIKKIRNAFILPYNMYNNKFGFNRTLEYIGYVETDYRKGIEEHEIIHAFLIDLKYVVKSWNKRNHDEDVEALVEGIEKIINKMGK